jgi:hypothetical protein
MRHATHPAAKVGRATTKVRGTTAAKMGGAAATAAKVRPTATTAKVRTAAATPKVRTAATATTTMRRGDCQRKAGNAHGQSGRQSGNNPTRHSITPTV